ncbi:MAG TPA: hypothetical protein PLI18_10745 [Pirellulaceae bacterium]|nr:hypothetical protein [Pirellulaceae bacterium]
MSAVDRPYWSLLVREVDAVRQRIRRRRSAWTAIIVALTAGAIAWGLRIGGLGGQASQWPIPDGAQRPAALIAGLIGVVALVRLVALLAARTPSAAIVVRDLERRFPDLDARLHAIWSERAGEPDRPWTFLQDQLLRETLVHARRHWSEIASPKRLGLLRLVSIGAIGTAALSLAVLLLADSDLRQRLVGESPDSAPLRHPVDRWSVAPGNCEIEIGSSLLVTVRLPGPSVDAFELVVTLGDSVRRLPMEPNLNDPVHSVRIPSIETSGSYRIESATGATREFSIVAYRRPRLESLEVRVVPPSFARSEPSTIRDPRRVRGPLGTRLEMTAVYSGESVGGSIVGSTGTAVLSTESVGIDGGFRSTVRGEWTVTADDRLTWQVADRDGRTPAEATELNVTLLPNTPPEVRWLFPRQDLSAHPLQEIDLSAEAEDDFGVIRWGFVVLDPSTAPEELTIGEGEGRTTTWSRTLSLEERSLVPGRMLAVGAWAEDQDETGAARRAMSDLILIDIRPFERIFRQADSDQAQAQAAERAGESGQGEQGGAPQTELAERQKQALIATWNLARREASADGWRPDLTVVLESQVGIGDELRELLGTGLVLPPETLLATERAAIAAVDGLLAASRDLSTEPLADVVAAQQRILETLVSMAPEENQVMRQQGESARSQSRASGPSSRELQSLQLDPDRNRYEQESAARDPVDEDQSSQRQQLERLQDLAQRQQDLNRELQQEATADRPTDEQQEQERQERLARLRERQRRLQEEAEELQEEQARTPSTAEEREGLQTARDAAQQASEALAQENVDEALTQGRRSARELDDLRERLDRRSGSAVRDEIEAIDRNLERIAEEQQAIRDALQENQETNGPGLRSARSDDDLAERMQRRETDWETELQRIRELTEATETTEPRVSERLYDAFREARQSGVDRNAEESRRWVQEGFPEQSRPIEEAIDRQLGDLRDALREASQLAGRDDVESLELAESMLRRLADEVDGEADEGASEGAAGDEASQGTETSQQPGQGQQPEQGQQPGQGQQPEQGQQPG